MNTTYTTILETLVSIQTQDAKKWLLKLKEKAEATKEPELFELYYTTAQVYSGLIKTIQQLAKQYQESLKDANTFSLKEWQKLKRLELALLEAQKDIKQQYNEQFFLADLVIKLTSH